MRFGVRAFEKWLGHEDEVVINEISMLIKETLKCSYVPTPMPHSNRTQETLWTKWDLTGHLMCWGLSLGICRLQTYEQWTSFIKLSVWCSVLCYFKVLTSPFLMIVLLDIEFFTCSIFIIIIIVFQLSWLLVRNWLWVVLSCVNALLSHRCQELVFVFGLITVQL